MNLSRTTDHRPVKTTCHPFRLTWSSTRRMWALSASPSIATSTRPTAHHLATTKHASIRPKPHKPPPKMSPNQWTTWKTCNAFTAITHCGKLERAKMILAPLRKLCRHQRHVKWNREANHPQVRVLHALAFHASSTEALICACKAM